MSLTNKIDKLIKNKLKTNASSELDRRIDSLITQAEHEQVQTSNIWRIAMTGKFAKIGIAAVLLTAAGIGLMHLQGDKEIQIPPELAQMSVEELLDIHNDLAESPFEKSLVEAALKNSLDKIGVREVLALARKNGKSIKSSEVARYVPKPVTEMIEASDIIIHGRVNKVALDVSDLKKAILRKKLGIYKELFSARIRAEVEMEVFEGYSASPVAKGEKLVLWPVINTRKLDVLQEGREYLILLKQSGETIWMLPYQEGVYPVDADTAVVSGFRSGEMSLEDAWIFMVGSYETIHEGKAPSDEELEYWTGKLESDDFADCWAGLEYFSTLRNPPDIADQVVKSIEKYHHVQVTYSGKNKRNPNYSYERVSTLSAFVTDALDLLIYINDEESIQKVISLSEDNVSADSVFNKSLFEYPTRDLQGKLKEAVERESVKTVQPRESSEIRTAANKKKIADAIEKYNLDKSESNLNRAVNTMSDHLTSEDKEFIPFLQEHAASHWIAPSLIARLGDASFVPVLLECLEKEISGSLLEALYACGERKTAIEIGIDELLAPVNATDWEQFDKELRRRSPIISFLGTCGDISALPAIEYYLDEDVIESLYQTNADLNGGYGFHVAQLRESAVPAFARLGGKSSIPKLKELYQFDDIHVKILAGLSLYYLGDDTGYDLLAHFVNNTQRSVPDIELRWHWDLASGAFQQAIKYLHSPRTDALMLEKMRHGLNHDTQYVCTGSFFEKYKSEVLGILVDQLSSKDRETRKEANSILQKLTGQDFGFQPSRFSGQQEEAIAKWQKYIE